MTADYLCSEFSFLLALSPEPAQEATEERCISAGQNPCQEQNGLLLRHLWGGGLHEKLSLQHDDGYALYYGVDLNVGRMG